MGKDKPSKKGAASSAPPKCNCDHPFNCDCGNRPERPSRGHKWDPEMQQWGGKGHKQKGGGQAAVVGVEAQTTTVGKTKIAQWQRLPSQVLDEQVRKEGRPPAKYKQIGSYKFRVIIQDAKLARRGGEHDIILMPSNNVDNQEQAKEEAALLALLHLTPTLPHELKLPEPYKTTWIHAVRAAKDQKKADLLKRKSTPNQALETTKLLESMATPTNNISSDGAKASTNLAFGNSFMSLAEKRKQQQSKRSEQNSRIRKHDAIRNANRDHQVFMSAKLRKMIENLLRGNEVHWEELDGQNEGDDTENDVKAYVTARLHSEGFTQSQAKTSFGQIKNVNDNEEFWERMYDECLQWLCIHLDENQLPEGFDPRGRMLAVVAAPSSNSQNQRDSEASPRVQALASKFGLTLADASFVLSCKMPSADDSVWNTFLRTANASLTTEVSANSGAENQEIAEDELEALEAIFSPEELSVKKNDGVTTISIKLPEDDNKLTVEIITQNAMYPSIHPCRILVSGCWSKPVGAAVQIELIHIVAALPIGDPMIFEIVGHLQRLLQSAADGELPVVALSSTSLLRSTETMTKNIGKEQQRDKLSGSRGSRTPRIQRPREKSSFWCQSPKQTPPATAFPDTGLAMKMARSSLPAAKARSEFLSVMKKADRCGRVVLVTGDTGCGKVTGLR